MLGTFLNLLEPAELRRIVDAPIEEWTRQTLINDSGQRCLIGHACGIQHRDELCSQVHMGFVKNPRFTDLLDGEDDIATSVGVEFDLLTLRFSLPRIVRACKLRALSLLTAQAPADNYDLALEGA